MYIIKEFSEFEWQYLRCNDCGKIYREWMPKSQVCKYCGSRDTGISSEEEWISDLAEGGELTDDILKNKDEEGRFQKKYYSQEARFRQHNYLNSDQNLNWIAKD